MSGVVNHKVWVALLVAVMAAAMMGALLVDGSDKPAHAGAFPSINEKIAYQSAVLAGFNNDIYTINLDGTYQTNLSISVRDDFSPLYSASGKKIAFVGNRNGENEIYTAPCTRNLV